MFLNDLVDTVIFFHMVGNGFHDGGVILIDFIEPFHNQVKGVIFLGERSAVAHWFYWFSCGHSSLSDPLINEGLRMRCTDDDFPSLASRVRADRQEHGGSHNPVPTEAFYPHHYQDRIPHDSEGRPLCCTPGVFETSGQEQPSFSQEEAPDDLSGYGEPVSLLHSPDSAAITACGYHLGVLLSQAIAQLDGTPQQARAIRQAVQLLYQLPTRHS